MIEANLCAAAIDQQDIARLEHGLQALELWRIRERGRVRLNSPRRHPASDPVKKSIERGHYRPLLACTYEP